MSDPVNQVNEGSLPPNVAGETVAGVPVPESSAVGNDSLAEAKGDPVPATVSVSVAGGDRLSRGEPAPTIGRVVHYVLPGGALDGQHRAAVVVNTNGRPDVALQVFKASPQDFRNTQARLATDDSFMVGDHEVQQPTVVVIGVPHDQARKLPGTWHWPER